MILKWVLPTVVVVGSLLLWHQSLDISSRIANPGTLGPAFMPQLVLTGLILVGLLQLGQILFARQVAHRADVGDGDLNETFHWGDLAGAVALSGVYVALLYLTGFLPATFVFQATMLFLVFRQRSMKTVVLVPIGLTTAYFVIFIKLLGMPLPQGMGWFRTFSQLVYY